MRTKQKPRSRNRRAVAVALAVTVAVGLLSRSSALSLPQFVRDHSGDALWTVAVYLGFCFLLPRARVAQLGALALATSFTVEFSQLLETQWLAAVRSTLPGRLILGTGFLWIDLVRYTCGALVAMALDTAWIRRSP